LRLIVVVWPTDQPATAIAAVTNHYPLVVLFPLEDRRLQRSAAAALPVCLYCLLGIVSKPGFYLVVLPSSRLFCQFHNVEWSSTILLRMPLCPR
jgi:hypothetical protein